MNKRSIEVWIWIVMRLTSMVLALAVVVHLATMIIVIHGGLSAAEVLARTRGSIAWAMFYDSFVVLAAVHAGIGLRNIVGEHSAWRGVSLDGAALAFALVVMGLGLRAVQGLFA